MLIVLRETATFHLSKEDFLPVANIGKKYSFFVNNVCNVFQFCSIFLFQAVEKYQYS